jgi:hypothetical protein
MFLFQQNLQKHSIEKNYLYQEKNMKKIPKENGKINCNQLTNKTLNEKA